jgi:hypothetical protein
VSRQNLGRLLVQLAEKPNSLTPDLAEWLRDGVLDHLGTGVPLEKALETRLQRGEKSKAFLEHLRTRDLWLREAAFHSCRRTSWGAAGRIVCEMRALELEKKIDPATIVLDAWPPPGLPRIQVDVFHAWRFANLSRPIPTTQKRIAQIVARCF